MNTDVLLNVLAQLNLSTSSLLRSTFGLSDCILFLKIELFECLKKTTGTI